MNISIIAEANSYAPTLGQRIIPFLVAVVIAVTTVELIRRRKLREEHAMLWLFASSVLVLFAIFPKLLIIISGWLGINYLTTLFLATFSFLMLIALGQAMVISRLTEDLRQTAQRVALLEQQANKAKESSDQPLWPGVPDVNDGHRDSEHD